MKTGKAIGIAGAAALLLTAAVSLCAAGEGDLQVAESPYFIIQSDAGERMAREAAPRLTAMIEMYLEAMKPAGAKSPKQQTFRLYKTQEDFLEAGGSRQTGACMGMNGMMAVLRDGQIPWEDVQCQAFYNFAFKCGVKGMPEWVSWWLAEYLALGQYTGDGYVMGAIKPGKLTRLQGYITAGKIRPLRTIMERGPLHRGSRDDLVADWDGAWGIMHYIMHAQDGKYRKQWDGFLKAMADGKTWQEAWKGQFGDDIESLEKECWAWWMTQTQESTNAKYNEAAVATLTSYLARAESAGQKFKDAREFLTAAKLGNLDHATPEQELPDELLTKAVERANGLAEWSLEKSKKGGTQLVLRAKDGMEYRGSFVLEKTKIKKVTVEVTKGEN